VFYNVDMEDKHRRPTAAVETYEPLKPGTPLTFGKLLRHIRKQRGMTLAQVSDASGIDQATISKMELGDRLPPELHTLVKISTALEIPEGSEGFKTLLTLALDERAEEQAGDEASGAILNLMRSDCEPDVPAVLPVFVNSIAELIARSNEYAISSGATVVTVTSGDGVVKRFQVLSGQKSVKQRRRS
jgi:transcriptional regulator with XRE-family HTH domain